MDHLKFTRRSLSGTTTNTAVFLAMSLFFTTGTFAASYEGTIGESFVWVDISLPAKDGSVNGSYFHKKNGNGIRLNGKLHGDTVRLAEKNSKGKVTGRFECVLRKNSMNGVWIDPKDTVSSNGRLVVTLEKSEPEYRKYAEMPKPHELLIDAREQSPGGQTVADIAQGHSDPLSGYTRPASINILYYKKDILSLCITWENAGNARSWGETRYAFNLQSKKEMPLQKEFDSSGLKKFSQRYGAGVANFITGFGQYRPHNEWADPAWLFGKRVEGVVFDHFDTISEMPGERCPVLRVDDTTMAINHLSLWSITPAGLNITHPGKGYFGFPPTAQALDEKFEIVIPLDDLEQYLKPNSILKHICK